MTPHKVSLTKHLRKPLIASLALMLAQPTLARELNTEERSSFEYRKAAACLAHADIIDASALAVMDAEGGIPQGSRSRLRIMPLVDLRSLTLSCNLDEFTTKKTNVFTIDDSELDTVLDLTIKKLKEIGIKYKTDKPDPFRPKLALTVVMVPEHPKESTAILQLSQWFRLNRKLSEQYQIVTYRVQRSGHNISNGRINVASLAELVLNEFAKSWRLANPAK